MNIDKKSNSEKTQTTIIFFLRQIELKQSVETPLNAS